MRFDPTVIMEAQRRAYNILTSNEKTVTERTVSGTGANAKANLTTKTIPNAHYVPPKLTTSPSMLIQELPWINTVTQFTFDFSQNGPQQIPGVNNNIVINKNDVFAAYAVQILFGTGPTAPQFIYRSHGILPDDNSLYNSVISMTTESSTYIDKIEGQFFRDNPANGNDYYGESGLQIINPIRLVSGELGKFKVEITLKSPIAALIISSNTVISMRLHGVYGQAQG